MLTDNIYIYLLVASLTLYAIRALPLTLIKGEITNTFIYSFLYYVPYVTLAVMTFPAILGATQSPIAALIALVTAIALAYFGRGLFFVAVSACVIVFAVELFTNPPAFISQMLSMIF